MTDYVRSLEGGNVFRADPMMRLNRFLICGSAQGTYYASGKEATVESVKNIASLLDDPDQAPVAIKRIVAVSDGGLAPKNDPAVVALALATCAQRESVRAAAWKALPKVCRIGTHLEHFFAFRKAITGGKWRASRMGRRAVSAWYNQMDPERMAYDMTKYQSRDGVSHADILRMMHPDLDGDREFLARYALGTWAPDDALRVVGFAQSTNPEDWRVEPVAGGDRLNATIALRDAKSSDDAASLVASYNLPRECVPTEYLNSRAVWESLATKMPLHATVRNLSKMTQVGLFTNPDYVDHVVQMLTGEAAGWLMKKQRMHPFTLLRSARQYAMGHGDKGKLTWKPIPEIVAALDHAYYLAFDSVEPTNKRILLCVDTSASMRQPTTLGLTSREIAAAMAMVAVNVEPHVTVCGFSSDLQWGLPLRKDMDLPFVLDHVLRMDAKGTYGKLPIEHAIEHQLDFDCIVYYTDGQFSDAGGAMSFATTLDTYRKVRVPDAKCVVVAAAANVIRVCHPDDILSLDVAGMDDTVPSVINSFLVM